MKAYFSGFSNLAGFEYRYQTRQILFWFTQLAFFLLALQLGAQAPGSEKLLYNAPSAIAFDVGLLSLFALLPITVFAANAMLRDDRFRMNGLIYATPVGKWTFLTARFAGFLLTGLSLFLPAIAGLVAALYLIPLDPARIAPLSAFNYLYHLGIIVIPNLFFGSALIFAIATLSRNTLATYLGGMVVYALYFVAAALLNSPLLVGATPGTPESMTLSALLDPLGQSAIAAQTYYWSVAEKNTRLLSFSGLFLINRLLWMAMGTAIFWVTGRLFSFRVKNEKKRRRSEKSRPEPQSRPAGPVVPVVVASTETTAWPGLISSVRLELRALVRNPAFLGMLLLWLGIVLSELITGIAHANSPGAGYPTTSLMVWLIRDPISKLGALILIFVCGELVWRERTHRFHEILDATPTANRIFFAAKLLTLAAIPLLLILGSIAAADIIQSLNGYFDFQWPHYFTMFYSEGLPLVLIGIAALLLQCLIPNQYLAMLVTLLLWFGLTATSFSGIQHHLLRFATAPEMLYSEMNGYGFHWQAFHWFMCYWGSLGLILGIFTFALWRRGSDVSFGNRLRQLGANLGKTARFLMTVSLTLFAGSGIYIFYNTNIVNTYRSKEARLDFQAKYELRYRGWDHRPQPSLVGIRQEVDLFPKERGYRVRGVYRFRNLYRHPIDSLLLSVREPVEIEHLEIPGAELLSSDSLYKQYLYRLDVPLAAGDSLAVRLNFRVAHRGFRNHGAQHAIVENGSFILLRDMIPWLGFRDSYRIQSPYERQKRGLSPLDENPDTEIEHAGSAAYGYCDFETVISTEGDQIALAPGELKGQWQEGNRQYFHYLSEKPIKLFLGYASARYAVSRSVHEGIKLEIYHHPEHQSNVAWITGAIRSSLDYCAGAFGEYPRDYFRLFEMNSSQYWDFFSGVGMPGMVGVLENRGFLADIQHPSAHLAYRRFAHEVAHQWWGHQLNLDARPGGEILVESLAKYTEMMILEHQFGKAAARDLRTYELDRYLRGRGSESQAENPLFLSERQPYLAYSKGPLVFYAIADLVGEETLNRILKKLVAHSPDEEGVNTRKLLDWFAAELPAAQQRLVEDWMTRIVFYDLQIAGSRATENPDGSYSVTVQLVTRRHLSDGLGNETPLPINESLQIACYSQYPDGSDPSANTLYHQAHHFDREESSLTFRVGRKPAYIAIDPEILRIDRNRGDNLIPVD